jgi:hypothetical protein
MTHELPDLMLALGRLEGKMDALLQMQRLHSEELQNQEERIRLLEHSRSFTIGAAAFAGALSSIAFSLWKH